MFEKFFPDTYVKSTYEVPFQTLYGQGYRGIIFDIDNTLVPHGAPADQRAVDLLAGLKEMGFSVCFLSNNGEERVKMFNREIGAAYIFDAKKPSPKGYQRAMERMGTNQGNTLCVGDQIFTDIWGGKRAGLYTVLVEYISPKEEIQIVLKRYLERIVLYFYKRKEETKRKQ